MTSIRHTLTAFVLTALLAIGLCFAPAEAESAGPPPAVIMETSMGRIILMLNPKDAPITVANFLKYVDAGFYDGTIFHRVVRKDDFEPKPGKPIDYGIVQGGGFDATMRQKRPLFPPIKNEASIAPLNKKGTIAMARSNAPDSATSQFFINVEDNEPLDYAMTKIDRRYVTKEDEFTVDAGYCVFGRVIRGMDVVEKMYEVKRQKKGVHDNVPVTPIVIKKVYRAR